MDCWLLYTVAVWFRVIMWMDCWLLYTVAVLFGVIMWMDCWLLYTVAVLFEVIMWMDCWLLYTYCIVQVQHGNGLLPCLHLWRDCWLHLTVPVLFRFTMWRDCWLLYTDCWLLYTDCACIVQGHYVKSLLALHWLSLHCSGSLCEEPAGFTLTVPALFRFTMWRACWLLYTDCACIVQVHYVKSLLALHWLSLYCSGSLCEETAGFFTLTVPVLFRFTMWRDVLVWLQVTSLQGGRSSREPATVSTLISSVLQWYLHECYHHAAFLNATFGQIELFDFVWRKAWKPFNLVWWKDGKIKCACELRVDFLKFYCVSLLQGKGRLCIICPLLFLCFPCSKRTSLTYPCYPCLAGPRSALLQ